MSTEMSTEPPSTIYERLRAVQNELHAPKDQTGRFGKHRSAEKILEAVKPLCDKQGLLLNLTDAVVQVGERNYVRARASVHTEEGSIDSDAFAWEGDISRGLDASQVTGVASSYARKYALQGLFAIDDGKDADHKDFGDPEASAPAKPAVGTASKNEPATDAQRGKIKVELAKRGVQLKDMPEYLENNFGIIPGETMLKVDASNIIDALTEAA